MSFDYILENYLLFDKPILITELLKDLEECKTMFEVDKKPIREDMSGWNKNFYCSWAVHKTSDWRGYLILDKSRCEETDNKYIIADGIGY